MFFRIEDIERSCSERVSLVINTDIMKKLLLFALCVSCLTKNSHAQQVQINLNRQYQTITGFGGFGAKKAWWDPAPHHDAEYLTQAIDVMGSNMIRTQLYWDFEPANDNNDPYVLDETKLKFGPTSDNGKQFDFLKDVHAKGCKIIVSVWTPPTWMKDRSDPATVPKECYNCMNPAWGCTQDMCGGVLKPEFYEEFAEYLVAYVKVVKKQTGIDIYALSIQNEALFANPFESAVLKPKPFADVLKIVGARFVREGLPQLLFGPEHMAEYSWGGNKEYVNELYNLSTAGKDYLDAFAVHGYLDGVANDYGSATGWTDLYNNVTVANGTPLWMTETGNLVANTFEEGFNFAKSLHLALKFGHISAWVFWAMNENLIIGNTLTHTGNAMKTFYKHIKPGYINVEATTTDAQILITAYKLNKSLVVVAINNSTSGKNVQLSTGTAPLPSSFKVYRYSATEKGNLIGTVTNNNFALPANSVTTMVYEDLNMPDTQAPTAPTLTSTGKTTNSVSLSWAGSTDNVGVTGYDVYNGSNNLNTTSINGTTYTVSNLSANTTYNFTVKSKDAAGNTSIASNILSITTSAAPIVCSATGNILREVWLNIEGTDIPSMPTSAPSSSGQISIFESPTEVADNYLSRVRGYICPPTTGAYTFYIASDDNGELWLSTNDNPANKVKVASVSGWTSTREWTKYPSQKSVVINLNAGQKYYIEALHKEGGGGDNLAVGWDLPDGTQERPIPGSRLSPSAHDLQAPTSPTLAIVSKTSTSVSLSWTASSDNFGVNGYDVYNGSMKINTSAVTGTAFTANNLNVNTTYSFTVKAFDAAGNVSIPSNTVTATTSVITMVKHANLENSTSVFPNPTTGIVSLTIKNDELGLHTIAVYDVAGKKHLTAFISKDNHILEVPLNLSGFPSGVYYIETINLNSRSFKKVQKY